MLNEGLRQRLEALNRGPLPTAAVAESRPRQAAVPAAARPQASPLRPRVVQPIPGLLRRGELVANEHGEHWRIRLPLEQLWPGGADLAVKRHAHLTSSAAGEVSAEAVSRCEKPGRPKLPTVATRNDLAPLLAAFPDRVLLLDLETCGLAGSALFLVGLLRQVDRCLEVELLLARNYSEERAVIASLWQHVDADRLVVTFNGKSFDWPMIVDRSRRHLLFRGSPLPQPEHVDLLHAARRRWRGQFADCRLQTLERHVCGRSRADDIPGHQIPAAYEQYVRTGYEREMDLILLHNAIDLVTMLDLAMRLAG